MDRILMGNALSLIGAILMACIGLLKKRKQILTVQCVQFGIMGLANLVLGGITGTVSAAVSIARNLVCAKRELTVPLKILFTVILVALSLYANTAGWLGVLPMLSTCIYTWLLDIKGERRLKAVLIVAQVFWLVFDLSLSNYVSFAFDIITIITNLIGIVTLTAEARKRAEG